MCVEAGWTQPPQPHAFSGAPPQPQADVGPPVCWVPDHVGVADLESMTSNIVVFVFMVCCFLRVELIGG